MLKSLPAALGAFLLVLALLPSAARADKVPPDVTLTGHTSPLLALAFSPDGKRLASLADDGKLKLWDLDAKKEIATVDGARGNKNQLRFTPDGRTVVAVGSNNNVLVVDAATGKPRKPIDLSNPTGIGGVDLDVSPDGKTVAVVGRGGLRLFDLAAGTLRASYVVHKGYETLAVAYSPDGASLVTVGSDRTAVLLDPATGKVARTVDLTSQGDAVAVSPDGKTVFVVCGDRVTRSFAAAADGDGSDPKPLVERGIVFRTLAVSPDGKALVLGGSGGGPMRLATADGKPTPGPDLGVDDRINAAAVSRDGKWLAGGGNEGGVFLWKADR
jgi:WD40 repeat protein